MQTLTLGSQGKTGELLTSRTSLRLRAFRLLSERYVQREPGFAAEFFLFAVIVVTSTWAMFSAVIR